MCHSVTIGENGLEDPYYKHVEEQWQNIMYLYWMYADNKPIMLFDIQEQKIYAYPYDAFVAELSPKSRASLIEQYAMAVSSSKIVVFVRDNENRRLVSYAVPYEENLDRSKQGRRPARGGAKAKRRKTT